MPHGCIGLLPSLSHSSLDTDPMDDAGFSQQLVLVAEPLLISLQSGALITWGLQGIIFVQVYNYYLSFPKDPIYMKLLVYGSLALEIIQTILVTRDTYATFTTGYGNFFTLNELHFLWLTLPIFGGVVGLLCHFTFAYRIIILSESRVIGILIIAIATSASTAAFIFGAKLHAAGDLSNAVTTNNVYILCGFWNGAAALCDLMIAGCMTFYLTRSNTGFKKTDYVVTRIIRMSIETGIMTATSSIASAVLFVGFRQKLIISVYFIIPAIMLTKLYAITILATFNNRPHAVGGPPPLSDPETSYDDSRKTFSRIDQFATEIRIGRTVVQQVFKDDSLPMSPMGTYDDASSQITKEDSGKSTGLV
ncbi:hypothetical protein D9619_010680 [Psilocybe cf. subviscida]|uniref:DUF6534 domain-containing protein n=1 Tax=Psilocybe cf. subviscida TaxID=2480587 RepID=A0A8H5B894_9AGAR|nr:hypothetical protein D9619_010680 [Psilocybe cf. subviscida]